MHPETDPDAGWVAALSGRPEPAVREALREAAAARGLYRHLDREHRSEGRRSYVEIEAPLELHALVRLLRPGHLVEVGVSSGVSSAYLLHALALNRRGTLHSVDRPARRRPAAGRRTGGGASWSLPEGRTSGWAVPERLRAGWDLRLGDKRDLLPTLARELPRVDLLLYDVPHEEADARREFRAFEPILAPGGVVIADHGPGGGRCAGLRSWAARVGAPSRPRAGTGLFGFRRPGAAPGPPRPRGRPSSGAGG